MYRGRIPDDYFVPQEQITKWKIEKGAKRKQKFDKSGFSYIWSEGKIDFPDLIDKQRFLPYLLWFNALGIFALIIPNRSNDYLFKDTIVLDN